MPDFSVQRDPSREDPPSTFASPGLLQTPLEKNVPRVVQSLFLVPQAPIRADHTRRTALLAQLVSSASREQQHMKVLQTRLYVLQDITVWQTLSTQHSALAYLELTHQLGFLVSEL